MFKFVILLVCLMGAIAQPATERLPERERDREREFVPILKAEMNKHEDGSYSLLYESGDGTIRQEEAVVVDAGTDEEALEVKGSYKYINDEGQEVEVFYTAGKQGFVPYGSIINPEISAVAEAAKELPKVVYEKPVAKHPEEY